MARCRGGRRLRHRLHAGRCDGARHARGAGRRGCRVCAGGDVAARAERPDHRPRAAADRRPRLPVLPPRARAARRRRRHAR